MRDALNRLSRTIGYQFADEHLLESALTHRSASVHHNERLEFLGDAILSFIIANELFQHHSRAREGELTRLRASLVRRETLVRIARDIDLGAFLTLGAGELKSGGRARDSILADAFEALVGAVYLDSDIHVCSDFVLAMFETRLCELASVAPEKDPKTKLQEFLQARHHELPQYTVMEILGGSHEHPFTVECRMAGYDEVTHGVGSSRRRAEQDAARLALLMLESVADSDAHCG